MSMETLDLSAGANKNNAPADDLKTGGKNSGPIEKKDDSKKESKKDSKKDPKEEKEEQKELC